MNYLGGKSRQAAHLAPIITTYAKAATKYYEPFLGGGFILERVANDVPRPEASDVHPDLILMWQALLDGWEPPTEVSREEYQELRTAEPSPLRGFVGFGCSFGGKWFGGYASNTRGDDYCGQARRGARRKAQAMRAAGARITLRSYADLDPEPGSLIYCDPPYAGTTDYKDAGGFDSDAFWVRVREWSDAGCAVLVSEYSAPAGAHCIWERASKVSLKRDDNTAANTERLFVVASGALTINEQPTSREKGATKIMNDTSSFFGRGQQASADVSRDQWGRYLLPDSDGRETGWTRATTFASTLAEQHGLSLWHQRQAVWGLARRPDLIETLATISGPEDKRAIGSVVDEAHIAAGTQAKANRGTALHKACELADTGNAVPEMFHRDVAAYRNKLGSAGLSVLGDLVEKVIVVPEYLVAGTPDRYVRCPDGKVRVLDIKTGNLDYAALEFAVQLALYAHAKAWRDYSSNTYQPLPEIEKDYAIIAHIRPDSGVCELYRVNITAGWAFARLCAEVRDARKHKHLITPLTPTEPSAAEVAATAYPTIQAAPSAPALTIPGAAAYVAVAEQHAVPIEQPPPGNVVVPAEQRWFGVPLDRPATDTTAFWEMADDPQDEQPAPAINGVPVADIGVTVNEHGQAGVTVNEHPDGSTVEVTEDPLTPEPNDQEAMAQGLAKLAKAKLQEIARRVMAHPGAANANISIKINQHRIKIAREIIAACIKIGMSVPEMPGSGSKTDKPSPAPAAVDTTAADKVAAARDAQWEASMFEAIRNALTVDKLQVLREQAGPKWSEEMTSAAREHVAKLDAQRAERRTLSPLEMINGATSMDTVARAWNVATQNGQDMAGWTAELNTAADAKKAQLLA